VSANTGEIMSKRNVYHVTYNNNQWEVNKVGNDKSSRVHDTKKEAVDSAKQLAKNQEPSQIVIHKKDGKIQEERTYSKDPFPPKG
jgi:hypothetical protein